MANLLLAYLFVCFSVGLVCIGITVVVVHRTASRVARAFLAFYAALTLLVLASLLLAFVEVLPSPVAPETRAAIEYLESIVGFYGVMFTLPFFAHRVFAVPAGSRDRILLAIVGAAVVAQHWTEYGLGGRWDERGDVLENLLFIAIVAYTLVLAIRRLGAPGVDRPLAVRFLVLFGLCIPALPHDLFLIEVTSLRLYPLLYAALSIVIVWTLYRRAGATIGNAVPAEWNLSDREGEVVSLVLRGLSNKEIAAELYISSNTVKTHLRAVFDKSGCRSRFALMSALASGRQAPGHPVEDPGS